MLILTRRRNESIHIGTDVVVTVLSLKGNEVRLGITAPRTVVVDRAEVHQRKLAEYTASARVGALGNATEPREAK